MGSLGTALGHFIPIMEAGGYMGAHGNLFPGQHILIPAAQLRDTQRELGGLLGHGPFAG